MVPEVRVKEIVLFVYSDNCTVSWAPYDVVMVSLPRIRDVYTTIGPTDYLLRIVEFHGLISPQLGPHVISTANLLSSSSGTGCSIISLIWLAQ
jgi:hypothetical protein